MAKASSSNNAGDFHSLQLNKKDHERAKNGIYISSLYGKNVSPSSLV